MLGDEDNVMKDKKNTTSKQLSSVKATSLKFALKSTPVNTEESE